MMTKRYVFSKAAICIEENFKLEGFRFIKSNSRILKKYYGGFNLILSHVFENTGQPGERGTSKAHSEHYMDYFNTKQIFWKTDWEFIYKQTTP